MNCVRVVSLAPCECDVGRDLRVSLLVAKSWRTNARQQKRTRTIQWAPAMSRVCIILYVVHSFDRRSLCNLVIKHVRSLAVGGLFKEFGKDCAVQNAQYLFRKSIVATEIIISVMSRSAF